MLIENLAVATLMVCLSTCVHFFGLTGLIAFLRRDTFYERSLSSIWLQSAAILTVILVLFLLHSIEIWMFAVLYLLLGEFSSFEEALYFSTSTFTTVGFGDVYLDKQWRLLSAMESAAGFLLIGWSTAFLVSVTAKLQLLESLIDPSLLKKKNDDSRDLE